MRVGCKMPCESCAVQFSVFRRKRVCNECLRTYCAACLRRGGTGTSMCAPCRALSTRPLSRHDVAHLKVRDLQCFLQRQNVSTRGCVEKDELVGLCVSHVNSAAYRRRGAGPHASAAGSFTFKGLTTNINDFITSALDLRHAPPASHDTTSQSQHSNCYNAAHAHSPTRPPAAPTVPQRDRFTTRPGGEEDISVEVPAPGADAELTRSSSGGSARVDTADCFEIEDLDDAGWEFVTRAADPLPNDSEVLMTATEELPSSGSGEAVTQRGGPASTESRPIAAPRRAAGPGPGLGSLGPGLGSLGPGLGSLGPATPQRAVSELELNREVPDTSDTTSLQDEPLMDNDTESGKPITLEHVATMTALEALSVRQLKELLVRNRVEYRGCLERADLLERARTLWRDHAAYRDQLDSLPIEESCKICMAAPLECVLLECGHIATCTRCARQLAECPICRQYVVRAVRCFRS